MNQQLSRPSDLAKVLEDPLNFLRLGWPHVKLYDRQVEIIRSVVENDETIVVAGNQLGKDFITAFIALWFFCTRYPARVVTSSSGQTQLVSVLWGELKNWINTCRIPLPIHPQELKIRQINANGMFVDKSYLIGIVTVTPENMQGHHLARDGKPRTMAIFDEASGIDDAYYNASSTWSHKRLIIGNPLPCTNFFYRGVKGGDVKADFGDHYHRKIIKIRAQDSPNVRLAEEEIAAGLTPSYDELVPGVVDYRTYSNRRKLWDPIMQCVGLDAEFYEGKEVKLYPPQWLLYAQQIAAALNRRKEKRIADAIGVDVAEGSDDTVWTVIDSKGILEQIAISTNDTAIIPGRTIALMKEYGVSPEYVCFDRGGGGKQHADLLREQGYAVRSIGFGEGATPPDTFHRMRTSEEKEAAAEQRYTYKNRRAEMYGMLRFLLLDPINQERTEDDRDEWISGGFGIGAEYEELLRQLAVFPLLYDGEGRLYLPPKDKTNPDSKQQTIKEMLGRSPDHADSLVLAVYAMLCEPEAMEAGLA